MFKVESLRMASVDQYALQASPLAWPSKLPSALECAPMKDAIPSNSAIPVDKKEVIEMVIDIFVRVIGFIDRADVSRTTHVVKDFSIDTDDLSLFALEVDRHFGIRTPPSEDWPGAEPTIEAVADRVLDHLSPMRLT
jgi:hypothetical protein